MTDLSGLWEGTYAYPTALQPVPFRAELRDHGGRLTGEVREPASGELPPGEVFAVVTGSHADGRVRFTKVYDLIDRFRDPVHYRGTLDEEECEIAGSWTIGGSWSGTFVMTRPRAMAGEQEAEEVVELDPQA